MLKVWQRLRSIGNNRGPRMIRFEKKMLIETKWSSFKKKRTPNAQATTKSNCTSSKIKIFVHYRILS